MFETEGDILVVAPAGQINGENAAALEADLLQHIAQGHRRIVFDFGQVEYISSAGLRVLLVAAKRLQQEGGRLALGGLKPQVREVFDISGFLNILNVVESRQDAVAAVSAA